MFFLRRNRKKILGPILIYELDATMYAGEYTLDIETWLANQTIFFSSRM